MPCCVCCVQLCVDFHMNEPLSDLIGKILESSDLLCVVWRFSRRPLGNLREKTCKKNVAIPTSATCLQPERAAAIGHVSEARYKEVCDSRSAR